MKTAIFYRSHHGTTAKVAGLIAIRLKGHNVTLIDLGEHPNPDLSDYDMIIIGGSIHLGMIQKDVEKFCESKLPFLLQKRIGLYICCLLKEQEEDQFQKAYPEKLRNHSIAHGFFGGELLFDRMNFLERLIIQHAPECNRNQTQIDLRAIDQFVYQLNKKKKLA